MVSAEPPECGAVSVRRSLGKNNFALVAICLTSLMFGLEISSVPVTLPIIQHLFKGSFGDMQWIVNAYTLAVSTILMAVGTLVDRFGRRVVFLCSLALFGLTSLLCGLAQDVPTLIVGRALQGASGGAMLISQVAVLSGQFHVGRKRARAFSAWGIFLGIGLGFGPTIGGVLVDMMGWEWVFLIHALLAMPTFLLLWFGVEKTQNSATHKLDVFGILALSLGVFGLVYAITRGPEKGFTSGYTLSIIACASLAFAAFVGAEKVSHHPAFDFSLLKLPRFSGALMGSIGMNFSFWPFMIYIPIYFQVALGYDPATAGVALLAYTVPTLIFPPLGERIVVRMGPAVAIPVGLFTIGLGFFLMKLGSIASHPSALTMLPGCALAGAGLGLTNTPVTNTTTGAVSADRAGMASGIDMTTRMLTLAINISLMGAILTTGILSELRALLPAAVAEPVLRPLVENIVAGNVDALRAGMPALDSLGSSATVLRKALNCGFGWTMLYGGIGAWILAALSLLIFRSEQGSSLIRGGRTRDE
ncbi:MULTISPECIES: MFS transporter [unclassified Caballeronia]|uniref:MFS transporter n=1 Tax=unclassified Caballeronia TaxID=2646786 RepID=UPI001F3EFCB2|nr:MULTISPECIES: MFS transporter [unclassified Caballeronia]MCE4546018.1 MFS transporter [Caballeronia sp. PC1]MCE4573509.1 MFS transporter [Caballeronia sp. CLC5]